MSVWSAEQDRAIDLIFSQNGSSAFATSTLHEHAYRYFGATLLISGEPDAGSVPELTSTHTPLGSLRLSFRIAGDPTDYQFRLRARHAIGSDYDAAEAAELRGNATGMSTLARRCHTVWLLEAVEQSSVAARYLLLATLASCALGPVLPAGGATLLGVRSARLLAERALGTPALSQKPLKPSQK